MSNDTPARPALDLTIRAQFAGWPVDVHLSLPAEKLGAALARLGELGYTPREAAVAAAAPSARPQARPKVEPVYKPDGTPCCPVHHKPLSEGRYGLYCPAKAQAGEEQNDKGYCALKFDA